ncbi:MAG: hypothetical protein EPN37_15545 [Chitinophagaceae bacterium]|nr:MAG: hypothetical protein EPN37_15545 [Chitinophagaceae bacterium]
MKKSIAEFLQFNGRNIYFQSEKGITYVAIKPICEALGINYNRQFQNLKNHVILSQLFAKQQMVAADGRMREMICLSEFYVYGWIFSIQSDNPELVKYQWECYKILYNHFHGSITGRASILQSKTKNELEIERLEAILKETEEAKKIDELKQSVKAANKSLAVMDKELATGQLSLFPNL